MCTYGKTIQMLKAQQLLIMRTANEEKPLTIYIQVRIYVSAEFYPHRSWDLVECYGNERCNELLLICCLHCLTLVCSDEDPIHLPDTSTKYWNSIFFYGNPKGSLLQPLWSCCRKTQKKISLKFQKRLILENSYDMLETSSKVTSTEWGDAKVLHTPGP